jgi:Dolichyl-phosphate-mannose-protein mannosyltransferase
VLMQPRRPNFLTTMPAWSCRLFAAVLILGAAALHIGYLTWNCPLDLAPDEAHYWDWSRHLDWSYYSKGPLVAWLIRGGCELFGPWATQHTGSLMPAIRMPAVICGALLLVSLYVLTKRVYGRESLALAVVGLALTLPLIAVGSSLMTIDSPYTCCWGWALVFGHVAVTRGAWWAWVTTGLLVGVGILAKYTMVLFLPSVGLFLLTTPAFRQQLWRPGFWLMCVVAAVCCLPIVIWNMQHDWVTVRHLLGLSGLHDPAEGGGIHWLGPLKYVGGQFALLLGYWFVAWLLAMIAHQPLAESNPHIRYLWWLSAPMFLLFLAFSPKTDGGELNWPVTAYLSGLVLAAGWIVRQLNATVAWYRRLQVTALALACLAGLTLTAFAHYSHRTYPLLSRLMGPPTPQKPYPLRNVDPSCRLRGWHFLASEVDRICAEVAAKEGREAIRAGCGWNLPGELGVYGEGHPQVFSIGLVTGDRHSQYDLWPNPISDGESFKGRTFVIVGGLTPDVEKAFKSIEPKREVKYTARGQPIATWLIWICHDFQGFKVEPNAMNDGRHY